MLKVVFQLVSTLAVLGRPVTSAKVCLLGLSGTGSSTASMGVAAINELRDVEAVVLSRRTEAAQKLYENTSASVVKGSIFEVADIVRACTGATLAIFSSPYGVDTSGDMETTSVEVMLEGFKASGVKKVLFTCAQVLTSTSDEGPMIQDRKIQDLILKYVSDGTFQDYAIIQTCAWMETAFDHAVSMINRFSVFFGHGFPKPVCYTRSRDIGLVTGKVAAKLLQSSQLSDHEFDVHDYTFYTSQQILFAAATARGRHVYGTGFLFYKAMVLLRPIFELMGLGRAVHLSKIFQHMLDYGYVPDLDSSVANQNAVARLDFKPSTLQDYFNEMLVNVRSKDEL